MKKKSLGEYKKTNKKWKYLGINLTKDVQYHYIENYKILPSETKQDLNKWRDIRGMHWTVSSQNLYFEVLTSNGIVFGNRAYRR